MRLELPDENNTRFSEDDGGCTVNTGSEMVLFYKPTAAELRTLFIQFRHKLDSCILDLLTMDYQEVRNRYGNLEFTNSRATDRHGVPFGALSYAGCKLVNVRASGVTQAFYDLGYIQGTKKGAVPRRKMVRGMGSVVDEFTALLPHIQVEILRAMVAGQEPDQYLKLNQTCIVGLETLQTDVLALDEADVLTFLGRLVNQVSFTIKERSTRGHSQSRAKGSGYVYGPVWFAAFLASRNVLLFPSWVLTATHKMVPAKFRPILAFLSVPDDIEDIAAIVLNLAKDRRHHVAAALNVFIASALSSDMWSSKRFCPFPLIHIKESLASIENEHKSAAVNKCYIILQRYFGVRATGRPEAQVFLRRRRVNSAQGDFAWTRHPTPANTKVAARILSRKVEHVPLFVKKWADQLSKDLHLFGLKHVRPVQNYLSLWLIFLLTLDERDIPATYMDVDRTKHSEPFAVFLSQHYGRSRSRVDLLALSKMQFLWNAAAKRALLPPHSNPFDIELQTGTPVNIDASGREAIDPKIAAFMSDLNCRNDYGFARSHKKYSKRLLNKSTLKYEDVFLGFEAKVIDLCLNYGVRLVDARWTESGEGDEYIVNLHTMSEEPNTMSSAIKGRKQGTVRLFQLDDDTLDWKLGYYRITDKSGGPKFSPHLEPRIAKMLQDTARLQNLYNPLPGTVEFIDPHNNHVAASRDKIAVGFPAFRDPTDSEFHSAISEDLVRRYWFDFCKYAEPLIEQHFGFRYPLIVNNAVRFPIHDLRVTNATELFDMGYSLNDIAGLLGHVSARTSLRYVARKHARLHAAKENALRQREELIDPETLLKHTLEHGYVPTDVDNHVGVKAAERLLETGRMSLMTEFSHGLCPGGDCDRGGALNAVGKPTPVFRPRACSRCRFRLTGFRYVGGMRRYVNQLAWEIRDSVAREAKANEQLAAREDKMGSVGVSWQPSRSEALFRDQLMAEWGQEVKNHRGVLATARAMRAKGMDPDRYLVPTSEAFEVNETSFAFIESSELELLWETVGADILPADTLVTPPHLKFRFNEIIRIMIRNSKLDDVLLRAPLNEHDAIMKDFASVVIDTLETNEIEALIERQFDGLEYPRLAAVIEGFKTKALRLKGPKT